MNGAFGAALWVEFKWRGLKLSFAPMFASETMKGDYSVQSKEKFYQST